MDTRSVNRHGKKSRGRASYGSLRIMLDVGKRALQNPPIAITYSGRLNISPASTGTFI